MNYIYSLQYKLSTSADKNLELVRNHLYSIEKGSMVLLPELFFCGYDYKNMHIYAEMSKDVLEDMLEISKSKDISLCFTVPWKEKNKLYNRAFLIEEGKIIGIKDKIKLFPLLEEAKYFEAGYENPIFESRLGKIGILICFELRFTELVNDLKNEKIDILLIPSQWGEARKEHLYILSKARALELECYVAVANTWGKFLSENFAGTSGIYSPWGEVIAFSEKGNNLLKGFYDPKEVEKIRRFLPVYKE